jgi:flagellar biosynthesis/type III secretory pathway chaperone
MDFEAEITGLLDDLTSVQSELLDVLAQKRVALTKADLQTLTDLQPREIELSNRLAACQDRRTALLAEAKAQGRPGENVARLANSTSTGKPSKLGTQVKETAARMRILQHHSLANWVLAQRSLLHVSQLLEIIATGGQMRPTYGDRESVHACGSLVNQEA